MSVSSKPTSATSSGTRLPACRRAINAPPAESSSAAKIASKATPAANQRATAARAGSSSKSPAATRPGAKGTGVRAKSSRIPPPPPVRVLAARRPAQEGDPAEPMLDDEVLDEPARAYQVLNAHVGDRQAVG